MEVLAAGFASGRVIDLVVGLTLLEVVGLFVFRRVTGRGPRVSVVGLNLASGLCLMVAVRAALTGARRWCCIWRICGGFGASDLVGLGVAIALRISGPAQARVAGAVRCAIMKW